MKIQSRIVSAILIIGFGFGLTACGKNDTGEETSQDVTSDDSIIIPSQLTISPSSVTISKSTSITFLASGGSGHYSFSLMSGSGAVNSSTGQYTAPASAGSAQVILADDQGHTAIASITIQASGTGTGTGVITKDQVDVRCDVGVCVGPDSPPALALSPASVDVVMGNSYSFVASGGTAPYTFSMSDGGGSIVKSGRSGEKGYYTAPSSTGTASVQVTDSVGTTVWATINIVEPSRINVYRFLRPNGKHFYSTTYSEGINAGFHYEGVGFRLFSSAAGSATSPVYRCYSTSKDAHFFSYASNCEGANYEGVIGYVATNIRSNSAALYRFYNSSLKDYLLTTSYSEGLQAHSYGFQGQLGWALTQ